MAVPSIDGHRALLHGLDDALRRLTPGRRSGAPAKATGGLAPVRGMLVGVLLGGVFWSGVVSLALWIL